MIEVKLHDPKEMLIDEWRQLQELQRESFKATLERDPAEIDFLTGWGDPEGFIASHYDPNSEVGGRFNANQVYARPKIAVATKDGELCGWGYSADNASGGGSPEGPHNASLKAELIRRGKLLSVVKNHLWLREVAVKPGFQGQGVARCIGRTLLKDAIPLQPVTTYIWPELIPFLQGALERRGFNKVDEYDVTIFGENSTPVREAVMRAPTAWGALRKI